MRAAVIQPRLIGAAALILAAPLLTWAQPAALEPVGEPIVFPNPVGQARFSPAGKYVVAMAGIKETFLWDIQKKTLAAGQARAGGLYSPFPAIRDGHITPDDKTLIAPGYTAFSLRTGILHFQRWDIATGRQYAAGGALERTFPVYSYSRDGKACLVLSWADKSNKQPLAPTARIVNTATSKFHGPAMVVGEVPAKLTLDVWPQGVLSPDGRIAAIVFDPACIQRWDVAKGKRLEPDLAFPLKRRIQHLTLNPAGNVLVAKGDEGTQLWDLERGIPLTPVLTDAEPFKAVSADGTLYAVKQHVRGKVINLLGGHLDTHVIVRETATGNVVATLKPDADDVDINHVLFHPDGKHLVTTNDERTEKPTLVRDLTDRLKVWSLATGKVRAQVNIKPAAGISHLAIHPGGKLLFTTSEHRLQLWKLPEP